MSVLQVRKNNISLLVEALGIPEEFVCEQRSKVAGTEAPCMLLKRLTYSVPLQRHDAAIWAATSTSLVHGNKLRARFQL